MPSCMESNDNDGAPNFNSICGGSRKIRMKQIAAENSQISLRYFKNGQQTQ